MKKDCRIFGIGLPKTGTMSLHYALMKLGIDSVHYPIKDVIPALHDGNYKALKKHRAYVNCGEWHFAALDKHFPESLFIYTWREYDEWLVSIEKHMSKYEISARDTNPYLNRLELFGTVKYNEEIMETRYWAHKFAIDRYFNNKSNLLRLNVSEQGAYSKLCRFIGMPVVEDEFPHENRGN